CRAPLRLSRPCSASRKKVWGLEDLKDIQVPVLGDFGQLNVRVGGFLFIEKVPQNRFGVDPDEFFPENAMEQVDIAGMNAVAVVNHGKVTEAEGIKTIDRAHHVRGIKRMNEMRDDSVNLLPRVNPPRLILFI